ncbi:M48 family metallopeptidase [Chitinibacter tainanensis]|uniref:M48 family metallopeptidase n=1 Tax=Chitinibacter tainanensis TaxID=230667 RepID=UPI002357F6D1|nr:SprT family zinc-dependent metalloprotease [Chitinibacter tainanensis]
MSTEHHIIVSGIAVEIDRKDIKNLHLGVYPPNGRVRVAAPLAVSDEAIRLAVIGKLGWVKRQRLKFQNQPRQSARQMVSGETHFFLGKAYRLKVEIAQRGQISLRGSRHLVLNCHADKSIAQKERILHQWYRKQLRAIVDELLQKWQPALNVTPSFCGIRKMKTRWGSCNTQTGRIWLNLELAKKSPQCIEYIVVHELIHLLERHHNERFMALMDLHLGNWRVLRDELNQGMLAQEEWRY